VQRSKSRCKVSLASKTKNSQNETLQGISVSASMPFSPAVTPAFGTLSPAQSVESVRRSILEHGLAADLRALKPWLASSWQRCLRAGMAFEHKTEFAPISRPLQAQTIEQNQPYLQAARGSVDQLARLVAGLGYFALLTDANGVVIDVAGQVDRSDPKAAAIARVGVDLAESSVGTSAISAALAEHQTVTLHRSEHFLNATGVFTCAGAPVFDPLGRCVGMLDVTGIQVREHAHLAHLVGQMAAQINRHWLGSAANQLLLNLSWPAAESSLAGQVFGQIAIDSDGVVCGADAGARSTLPELAALCTRSQPYHLSELFARPVNDILALQKRGGISIEAPLWSGLAVQLRKANATGFAGEVPVARGALIGDMKVAMIKQAVLTARGNVNEAANRLGISRATIYRVLGKRRG
jgi:sigma-54 dependent transcriptional regulator, acetoin dehydrogenase operon transcriptional activator AcoR